MSDAESLPSHADRGPIDVLLIEDNPADARLVRELLQESERTVDLVHERTLAAGLDVLGDGSPPDAADVLLVDLGLPDSQGVGAVETLAGAVPRLPVVVLTGRQDVDMALSALEEGAAEYLRKDELTPSLLARTLQWAVERNRLELERAEQKKRQRVLSKAVEQGDEPLFIVEAQPRDGTAVLPDASAEEDADRGIRYVNPAFEALTGYDEDELLGRSPEVLYGPKTDADRLAALREALAAGEPWQGETVLYRKDDRPYVAQWGLTPVDGPDGRIEYWVCTQRDVTEERRREATLRRQQQQTERLVGAWSVDARSGDVTWSDETYRLHGVPPGTDMTVEDMLGFYVPEDRSTVREAFAACADDGETFELEPLLVTAEDERRWVRLVGAPVEDEGGRITKVAGAIRDVTDQRQAEELLREQEAQLRGLANSIPGVVYQFYATDDGEYGHHFVSEHAETLLGISSDPDTYFERFLEHVPPAPRESLLEMVDDVVDAVERFRFEIPFDRPDGERIWLQAVATPEEREDEIVFNGVLLDVSERKEYEQALQDERDRFETLFESLPTPVVYGRPHDEGVRVEEVNAAFEEAFGDEPDVLEEEIRGDGEESVENSAGVPSSRILDGEPIDREVKREAADGPRDFRLQVALRNGDEDTPPELYAIYTDITERKQWERALREEQSALRSLYRITADQDVAFEEKVRDLIDLGREYLDLPYGFLTRITEDTQHIVEAAGTHRLLQPGESCPLSESYCRKTIQEEALLAVQNAPDEGWDGDPAYEKFDLGSYIGSQVVVDGELYGTFCFAATTPRDRPFSEQECTFVELLTLWASYELEQRRAEQQLKRQNERLDSFASVLTHDLRNPLNVAKGRLGLAQEEHASDHLAAVDRSLDRMDQIIEDVLTLTWGRQDVEADDLEACRLGAVAEACWDQVASAAATLDLDAPPVVRAEKGRLRRLLENLFRNAVEHGGEDVTVRVGGLDRGFYVEDDGPGIPPEKRDEVLEAGYTSSEEGTGLGLSIVASVAETHGWSLSVAESPEGGARFEVRDVEVEPKEAERER